MISALSASNATILGLHDLAEYDNLTTLHISLQAHYQDFDLTVPPGSGSYLIMNGEKSAEPVKREEMNEQNPWPLVQRDQMAMPQHRPAPGPYNVHSSFPPTGPRGYRGTSGYSGPGVHRMFETASDGHLAQRYDNSAPSRENVNIVTTRNHTDPTENSYPDPQTLAHVTTGIRIGRLESENKVITDDLARLAAKHKEVLRENSRLNEQLTRLQQEQSKDAMERQRLLQEISELKSDGKHAPGTGKDEELGEAKDLNADNKRLRSERNYYRDRCYAAEREFDQLSSPRLATIAHSRRASINNTPGVRSIPLRDMQAQEKGEGPRQIAHSRRPSELKETVNNPEKKPETTW